jgi:hypothetical protein
MTSKEINSEWVKFRVGYSYVVPANLCAIYILCMYGTYEGFYIWKFICRKHEVKTVVRTSHNLKYYDN